MGGWVSCVAALSVSSSRSGCVCCVCVCPLTNRCLSGAGGAEWCWSTSDEQEVPENFAGVSLWTCPGGCDARKQRTRRSGGCRVWCLALWDSLVFSCSDEVWAEMYSAYIRRGVRGILSIGRIDQHLLVAFGCR